MSGLFGGDTTIEYPDPIDIGQSISEYIEAVSDPVLRDKILGAERTDRPQFRALDLQDINTMASGIQAGQANPEYARIQSELASLRAGDSATEGALSREEITSKANELYPITKGSAFGGLSNRKKEENKKNKKLQDDYIERELKGASGQNAGKIAELETRLANTPQTLEGTAGLFDLQDEASRRAGATTREALGLQREDDIRALETLGGRVVDAQRAADPSSTNLARLASERAGDFSAQERELQESLQDSRNENDAFRSIEKKLKAAGRGGASSAKFKDSLTDGEAYYLYQKGYISADRSPKKSITQRSILSEINKSRDAVTQRTKAVEQGVAPRQPDSLSRLGDVGEGLLGSQVQAASAAERALQKRGMSDVNARREAASAAERALQDRGMADVNARREAASQAERQLQQMGMTLGDLSPTEQEALISGRGSEFIQSTGELSPLEQRRAQQSARQGSLARGREMGQGSLYDEMLARQAEELNKEERQVALGSQLLGQEASMRGARLGQGAGMLQGSEALAAQRRLEQLQRQQFGTQTLGLTEDMAARRRAEQIQRQQFGTSTLGLTEDMAARRRQEQIQRMELGSGLIGQQEGLQAGRLNQAFNMNRSLSGDLGATILNRPSYATQLGNQTLDAAQQGAQQPSGAKLYDPNMGLSLAYQDQANQFNLIGAQAQADATASAGGLGAFGSILGGAFSGGFFN